MDLKKLERLGWLLEEEVAQNRLFGAAVTVGTRDGGRVYTSEHGDIRRDSLCMLCSMTKPITSIASWILIERGIIDPLEPLAKYLPGFADPKVLENGKLVPADRELLIRDVLNMVSGIPATVCQMPGKEEASAVVQRVLRDAKKRMDQGETVSNVEIMNAMGEAPLFFQPGERWNYGKNADVMGAVVEVASGKTLGEFFREEIFEPLEMNDTGFVVPKEHAGRVARIAVQGEGGTLKEISSQDFYGDGRELWEEPYLESGGGGAAPIMCRGLYSTLDDYAKFCSMLLHNGEYEGKKILSGHTVSLFSENHLTSRQRESMWPWLQGYGYGNLMRVMMDRGAAHANGTVGEFGWDGALGTHMFVDPGSDIYFTYMQQKAGDAAVVRKMRSIVYSAL